MVKKILKVIVLLLVVGFVVIQFFRIDKAAPAVVQGERTG